jgi:hypothetical protein
LSRHWQPALEYARLCAVSEYAAGVLTAVVFTRLFGETLRRTGPTAAWRPRLLETVLAVAGECAEDRRNVSLRPELRLGGSGRDDGPLPSPPEDRRIVFRAFRRPPRWGSPPDSPSER